MLNEQDLNRDVNDKVMRESNLGRGIVIIKGMKTRKGGMWEEWQVVQSDWNIKCRAHRRQ